MGDSGGPFVCRDRTNDRWYLHGAVSWGTRTCSAEQDKFTVFARISEVADWIKDNVGGDLPPPVPTTISPSPEQSAGTFHILKVIKALNNDF